MIAKVTVGKAIQTFKHGELMKRYNDKEINTDIELDDVCYNVTFNRVTAYSKENYGTDADGNRGEMRTFIDEDYAENIIVDCVPINELLPELQKKLEHEIENWLDDHEPEESEQSE